MDDLLDTAPCGFLSFTDDGTIVEANRTLLDLLGREGLAGQKVESILTVAGRIFYQTHFFPLVRLHGKADEIFFSLRSQKEGDVPVIANAVRRERGGEVCYHCVLVPVYQRRKYEDEILQARRVAEEALENNRELIEAKHEVEQQAQALDRQVSRLGQKHEELTRLSSILSHDLREPIRKIIMFADLLYQENEAALTETGRVSIEKINDACARADQLITTLQHYLSLDSGDEPLMPVELDEVVAKAVEHVIDSTRCSELRVTRDTLPVIEGYRGQLSLLFYHLASNAVKFRRPGVQPLVNIECAIIQHNSFRTTKGKYRYVDFAQIVFSDNGIGFDPKYSEYVFRLLTKLDAAKPGLGIGLAMCKKIVDNHYGSISADAEVGCGARITVLLPLKR